MEEAGWKGTGIRPVVIDEIRKIAQQCEIQKVILFGSRARGDFHRESDIDLAVLGKQVERFRLEVEENTSTLLRYDVIDLNIPLQSALTTAIQREGELIYEKVSKAALMRACTESKTFCERKHGDAVDVNKYDQYKSNLAVLETAIDQDLSNEFIMGGIIDKFFIQFELGWKVLKELLEYEGVREARSGSPRQIMKLAYAFYPCMEEDVWLSMLSQRNNMAHIYDGTAAQQFVQKIIQEYIPAFQQLGISIEERYGEIL